MSDTAASGAAEADLGAFALGAPVQLVGLGLIGCSVALALRRLGIDVFGSDLDAARERRALELGAIDSIGWEPAASLAVVATPVASIPAIVAQLLARSCNDDLVVTDVGSVKGPVVDAVDSPRFIGGHPMAGSEQEGPDGADGRLFAGATWVLTPSPTTDEHAFGRISALVDALGANRIVLTPQRHDALVAVVSHVPHLAAANLMALAADAAEEHGSLMRLAAGGFRDMTRIAAGDPAIWPDIFRDNREAVLEVLDALRERLDISRHIIESGDRKALIELLEYAKAARRNLPQRVLPPENLAECRVPVLDRPGSLAEVTGVFSEAGVNLWDLEIAHSSEGDRGVLVLLVEPQGAQRASARLVELGYHPSIHPVA